MVPRAGTGTQGCWLLLNPHSSSRKGHKCKLSAPSHVWSFPLCVWGGEVHWGTSLCVEAGHTDQTLPWIGVDAGTAEQSLTLRTAFYWACERNAWVDS